MEKKIRFKSKDAELWKRIEAVYPDKSTEYKEEVFNYLCSETKIANLKDHVAILEETLTITEPWAFYGKGLKKRAKEWSSRGGQREKKEPGFTFLVEYSWNHSKRKTCLGMWEFLIKELKAGDIGGRNIIDGCDFVYEKKTNKITLYFEDERKRPKEMGFRSFQRRVSDLKKDLRNIAIK